MTRIDAAAAWLGEARLAQRPIEDLPVDLRPTDEAAGYAIQRVLHQWFADHGGGAMAGHKIGCTTAAMQAYLGVDHACAGGIRAATIHERRLALAAGDIHRPGVECEIAMELRADVPDEPHTASGIAEYVGVCRAAMEVVDNRYGDPKVTGAATMIADDFFASACVLDEPAEDWRAIDLRGLSGRTLVNGEVFGSGTGADVMGDPLAALAWLAEHRRRLGAPLRAGDLVLTGSLVPVAWLKPGDHAEIVIDGLGHAEFRVS